MKRNLGFDIARSCSMLYIVGVLHLTGYTDLAISQNNAFVSLIWSTLGIFTFLSSYLLASRYSFTKINDVYSFYRKRVLRFYPLFLISSLLLLAIHFNTTAETLKGIVGISPFWKPQQHTLWYISMLIGLYILMPILCKNNYKYQCVVFVLILITIGAIDYLFHSVDARIYYYYIVYFIGILCAQYASNKIKQISNNKGTFIIALLIYLAVFIMLYFQKGNRLVMMAEGYLGIFTLLSICIRIGRNAENRRNFKSIISFMSYASMCAYLFHREIYWGLLTIWRPQTSYGVILFLLIVGVPIVFLLSYYIQKYYDKAIKSL